MNMEPLESTQESSRRLLWIGIGVVIVIVLIIAVISFAMMANTKKEPVMTSASPSPSQTVATKEQVIENIAILDTSVKQAAKDQTAAKAAIKNSENQTKIGN